LSRCITAEKLFIYAKLPLLEDNQDSKFGGIW